jgi:alkaline phosphatase
MASVSIGCLADSDAKQAKHIILLVGDGMNIEHEIATSRYLFGKDFALSFHGLPYQGNQATWDVNTYKHWSGGKYDQDAIVPTFGYDPAQGGKVPYPLGPELPGAEAYHKAMATDSAAAATAWATGYKTDNGNIAWLPGDPKPPDPGALKTIAELLREKKGFAIGVASTVAFLEATPAAFVSHNKDRDNYGEIGLEILKQTKPEVVISAGHEKNTSCEVLPSDPNDPVSPLRFLIYQAVCSDPGYHVVMRASGVDGGVALLEAAQQAVADNKKLFGLFGGSGNNFESLTPKDLPGTPLVTQATRENPTYAEATLAALKVLSRDRDGFFLMSEQGDIDLANHDNDFQRMVGTIKDLHDGVQAVIDFVNQPDDPDEGIDWDNTLLIVTADHSNNYMRNRVKQVAGDLPQQDCNGVNCYPYGEISYGSDNHTNELTRVYAIGAGVKLFQKYEGKWYPGTRILDNTQLFHVMMEAAGEPQASPLRIIKK